ARDAHMLGGKVEAVVPAVMRSDGRAQRRRAPRRRVLVRAFLPRARRGLEDFVGPSEIGEALAEVYGPVLRREGRHAFEDAGLHLLVKRVHARAIAWRGGCRG